MTLQRLREMCLALPGATEQIQWGSDLVFKIGGKMFCVACTEPVEPPKVAMSFKCDDETFAELVERDGVVPAPYLARAKWVALQQFDSLDAASLQPLIVRAFEIVSAKLPRRKANTKDTKGTKAKTGKKATQTKKAKKAKKSKATPKRPARRAAPARARRGR